MSPDLPVIKIGFDSLDIFPVFVDYDMENRKCRGLSAKLDLFSYGALTAMMEKMSEKDIRFAVSDGMLIKKSGLIFSNGFFLFDFKYLSEHSDVLSKKIKALNMPEVYVENSDRYDISAMVKDAGACRVQLLEFGDA